MISLLALAVAAHAYETDQLTWRDRPLEDSAERLNGLMDEFLADAVDRANRKTACQGTDDEVRGALAEAIHDVTSHRALVFSRGVFRAPGFSTYTRRVVTDPSVDRFGFEHREDIYGGLTLWSSVVLTLAGPCTTLDVGGVRIGDDKLDHFLDNGFHYLRDAEHRDERTAIERGTRTERSFYGMITSKTFSYADLRANFDGWRFYSGLLDEGSVLGRAADGCVEQRAPFDWRAWVNAEWDEVLNPPVYTHLVERGVLRTLEDHRDELCREVAVWDGDGSRERELASLPPPEYVAGPAPARRDPWQLQALCDPSRQDPLAGSTVRPRAEVHLARAEQRREAR